MNGILRIFKNPWMRQFKDPRNEIQTSRENQSLTKKRQKPMFLSRTREHKAAIFLIHHKLRSFVPLIGYIYMSWPNPTNRKSNVAEKHVSTSFGDQNSNWKQEKNWNKQNRALLPAEDLAPDWTKPVPVSCKIGQKVSWDIPACEWRSMRHRFHFEPPNSRLNLPLSVPQDRGWPSLHL